MHQPTPFSSPRHRIVGRSESGGAGRSPRFLCLFAIFAQFAVIALLSFSTLSAQLVQNGSFEAITPASAPTPGWSYSGPYPYALPGVGGPWYTYLGSTDVFWGPTYTPSNFMTSWSSPLTPFHGRNYAGISTGRFWGVFGSEVLAGTLSPVTGAGIYTVRARFAMGSARNQPSFIKVSLFKASAPTTNITIGYQLVNTTAWTLFSRNVTLPASPTYDRIRIEGVDSLPNNWGAYCFIDSVDVDRASVSPCDYLKAHVTYNPSSAGSNGCCWNLFIDNALPTWLPPIYQIRLTSVAPNSLSGPVTNGPGLTSVTTLPYTATWRETSTGPIPTGSGQFIGTYCLNAVTIPQKQIIDFLDQQGRIVCEDTLFTDCRQEPPRPCMDIAVSGILCGPLDAAGNRTYTFNMNLNIYNLLSGYVRFTSPQGTVSPMFVGVPPYTQVIPMTFTDIPPVDGHVCIYAEHHAYFKNKDSIVCRDTVCFDLPHCADDCCKNFIKRFGNISMSVSNGNVSLKGCVTAGAGQIKRFSATIVAAQLRSKCGVAAAGPWTRIFGDITGGTLTTTPALPFTLAPPTMTFSREAIWGGPANPYCVSMYPGCAPFSLSMIFPNPPTGFNCIDTLRFSIRYSFTDCNCLTCDTVITYQAIRRYIPIIWDGGGVVDHADAGGISSAYHLANSGLLNITMSSDTRGTLSVTLPHSPEGTDPIRIVGMKLRPEGVGINALTQSGTQNSATIDGNEADISYVLDEGQSMTFDVDYLNGNTDRQIRNLMVFSYMLANQNGQGGDSDTTSGDTTTSDTVVVYATTPSGGGDVVEPTQTSLTDVKTYALHLVASNNLDAAVHGLQLKVNGGATLIAVGPVGNGTTAVLTPGVDQNGNSLVQVDRNTWTIQTVEAQSTLDPIYLTFAGVGNNTVSVDFTTLDENGASVSASSVDISSPMRMAGVGQESAETGSELMPIYPNPSKQTATVEFTLREAGEVTISLRDLNGKEVLRPISGERLQGGDHLLPLRTDALPQGTYVVVLNVGGRIYTRPMTIVR